ncbi:DUF4870 domain-containing protein [Segetibacter sp. 3557_3]|uniref:DUF4870 domain-containing protein n=1 Tax=Segetibacter sp. 3557_3 TaxID=2547429 RepID=UPI001A9E6531|nr:DUF4870 domain-containing protein [Segetibacter sp. 3557_3]
MDQKTIAWLSYITIIGWIVALVNYNSSAVKSSLARFHLRQTLGLFLTGMALYILQFSLFFIFPLAAFFIPLLAIVLMVFWILGLVAAVNGEEKPVPFLGDLYQKTLTFVN